MSEELIKFDGSKLSDKNDEEIYVGENTEVGLVYTKNSNVYIIEEEDGKMFVPLALVDTISESANIDENETLDILYYIYDGFKTVNEMEVRDAGVLGVPVEKVVTRKSPERIIDSLTYLINNYSYDQTLALVRSMGDGQIVEKYRELDNRKAYEDAYINDMYDIENNFSMIGSNGSFLEYTEEYGDEGRASAENIITESEDTELEKLHVKKLTKKRKDGNSK